MTHLLFTSKICYFCCPQKWVNEITVARNNAKQSEKRLGHRTLKRNWRVELRCVKTLETKYLRMIFAI